MSCVSSHNQASSDAGESNVRPSMSVSPNCFRLQNGSWSTVMSPRSTMEQKKAVDRARGALHNANTAIGVAYGCFPERLLSGTPARLTYAELAETLGVSRQTVILIENGRYLPSLLLAFTIARFFGLTVDDMFGKEPERPCI